MSLRICVLTTIAHPGASDLRWRRTIVYRRGAPPVVAGCWLDGGARR